ncbi:MAG: DegV family protein [Anaerolineae bacterium]|nr:DegV family protein [Anaerolineae bacterium]
MSNVVVVTDSSAYIPDSALQGLNVPIIPLWLIWDDDRFRDGVDIDPETFYRRLRGAKSLPTTSQPSAGEFEAFFHQVAPGSETIVSVLLSNKLSGTVASAQAAQTQMDSLDVQIVDSYSVSMGLGFVVLAAARAAAAGKSPAEVVAAAEVMKDKMNLLFVVDTLEYLHRRGRIGGAKRLLGTALKIKPILHIVDGQIEPLSQARTKSKALAHMLAIAEERLGGKPMAEAGVVDIDSPAEGDRVAQEVKERFGLDIVHRSSVSPVVGATAGPGAIGLAFYTD